LLKSFGTIRSHRNQPYFQCKLASLEIKSSTYHTEGEGVPTTKAREHYQSNARARQKYAVCRRIVLLLRAFKDGIFPVS
jgi:hypothetical protein